MNTFHEETKELKPIILFFDLETSGLELDCDVLQIAVKRGPCIFNEYINPKKKISWDVYEINKLSNRSGELYYNDDIKLPSQPQRVVLQNLLMYLQSFGRPCILVAHNCSFDSSRLIRIIRQENLENEFSNVIEGFTDTLCMFREIFPERKRKGACTLTTLVKDTLSMSTEGLHDAKHDVSLLEKLTYHHFTANEIVEKKQSFADALYKQKCNK